MLNVNKFAARRLVVSAPFFIGVAIVLHAIVGGSLYYYVSKKDKEDS